MTRIMQERPLTRIVQGAHGEYRVRLLPGTILIRPLRARTSEVAISWESVYAAAVDRERPKRKRAVKRGLLTVR